MTQSRVFIVEDHPAIREHLVRSLSDAGFTICGSSSNVDEAAKNLPLAEADLAIVDVSLSRANGLEFAAQARKLNPNIAFLMFSGHRINAYVEQAKNLGLQGYAVKGDFDQLRLAIREILAGRTYFPEL